MTADPYFRRQMDEIFGSGDDLPDPPDMMSVRQLEKADRAAKKEMYRIEGGVSAFERFSEDKFIGPQELFDKMHQKQRDRIAQARPHTLKWLREFFRLINEQSRNTHPGKAGKGK